MEGHKFCDPGVDDLSVNCDCLSSFPLFVSVGVKAACQPAAAPAPARHQGRGEVSAPKEGAHSSC